MAWGWVNYKDILIWKWTNPFKASSMSYWEQLISGYFHIHMFLWYIIIIGSGIHPADSVSNSLVVIPPSRHAPDRTLPHPQTLRPPYDYPASIHIPPPPQQPRYLAEGTDWYVCIQGLDKLVLCLALIDWRRSCVCVQGSECGSRPAAVPRLSTHSTLSALPDLSTTAPLPQEHHLRTSGQSGPSVATAIQC